MEQQLMGQMIEFDVNGTSYSGYLVPSEKGTGPGVIVLHEWWGLVDHTKSVAGRLTKNGFTVLAVDCFHGKTTDDPDEAEKLMFGFSASEAERMINSAVSTLISHEATTGNSVGVVGFSMGGQLGVLAGCVNPNVKVCVTNYGINQNIHPELKNLRAPLMGLYAELDTYMFAAQVSMLDLQLSELGKEHHFKTYEGCHHGFFDEGRPDVYDREAAEDGWAKMLGFLHHYLG